MATLTTASRNRIKASERYAERDDVALLTLHQNGGLSIGKIVKVNDKIGIVSKIIGGGEIKKNGMGGNLKNSRI